MANEIEERQKFNRPSNIEVESINTQAAHSTSDAHKHMFIDLLRMMVCCTGVVSFWRGGWLVLDWIFVDFSLLDQALISLLIGALLFLFILLIWFVGCITDKENSLFNPMKQLVLRYCIYMIYAWIGVACWRGVWYLNDAWIVLQLSNLDDRANQLLGYLISTVGGMVLLIVSQQVTGSFATPILAANDRNEQLNQEILFSKTINATLTTRRFLCSKCGNKDLPKTTDEEHRPDIPIPADKLHTKSTNTPHPEIQTTAL